VQEVGMLYSWLTLLLYRNTPSLTTAAAVCVCVCLHVCCRLMLLISWSYSAAGAPTITGSNDWLGQFRWPGTARNCQPYLE
jgi:hypothetical protein